MSARRQRGYVLAEAMVAGAVLAWALVGLLGAVAAGREHQALADDDQLAGALAAQKVEELLARPQAGWDAAAGSTVTEGGVGGREAWTRQTQVLPLQSVATGAGPLWLYEARVTVTDARGRSTRLAAVRWKAY